MYLAYAEAQLFARAGEDVRREAWPAGDFLRWTAAPPAIDGYTLSLYSATSPDQQANDWRRA